MVNSINPNISAIQFFNAANAFKTASKPIEKIAQPQPEVPEGISQNDNTLLKNVDVDDVKKYASLIGENNVDEEDIKYGLTYGRSVLADWVV